MKTKVKSSQDISFGANRSYLCERKGCLKNLLHSLSIKP